MTKLKSLEDLEDVLLEAKLLNLIQSVDFKPHSIVIQFHETKNVRKTIHKIITYISDNYACPFPKIKYFHTRDPLTDDDYPTLEIFHFAEMRKQQLKEKQENTP